VPAPIAVHIVSVAEFDPPPLGDGKENPSELGNLTDGDPGTTWSTVCYNDRSLAPKKGVGLVFQLSGPARGHTLTVVSPTTGGWGAQVYVASAPAATLDGWGTPLVDDRDLAPGSSAFPLGDPDGRYVLLFIDELGQAAAPCTTRPWQVRIGEVTVG
jgi:hypothetical protein